MSTNLPLPEHLEPLSSHPQSYKYILTINPFWDTNPLLRHKLYSPKDSPNSSFCAGIQPVHLITHSLSSIALNCSRNVPRLDLGKTLEQTKYSQIEQIESRLISNRKSCSTAPIKTIKASRQSKHDPRIPDPLVPPITTTHLHSRLYTESLSAPPAFSNSTPPSWKLHSNPSHNLNSLIL